MKKNNYVIHLGPKDVTGMDYILKYLSNHNSRKSLDFFTKTLFINPLEIHKNSLVIKGFNTEPYKYFTPKYIEFRGKQHVRWRTKIIDTMITPEISILYVDNDISKWPHPKGIVIYLEADLSKYYVSF